MSSSSNGIGKRPGDATSASASTSTSTSDPYLTNDFFPLTQASNAILAALRADESAPDADLYRRIASSSNANSSTSTAAATATDSNGNNNQGHLYRSSSLVYNTNTNATTTGNTGNSIGITNTGSNANATRTNTTTADIQNTIHHENSIPLPPYLTNIIKETKLSSLMGILPEGNMVWVSVDDSLYIWEYGHGSLHGSHGNKKEDFVCFQVPSGQCVVSVGIVKPKPGTYILLLDCSF